MNLVVSQHCARAVRLLLALLVAAGLLLPAAHPAAAQDATTPPAPLQVSDGEGGVHVVWNAAPAAAARGASVAALSAADLLSAVTQALPAQRYQGYDLPLRVTPLRFAGPDAVALPQVVHLETVDLPGGLVAPGAPALPPVLLEDGQEAPQSVETVALPTQPVFVLRAGWVQGEYLVMVAISPVFVQDGVVKLATVLETVMPGATAVQGAPWNYADARAAQLEAADAALPTYAPAAPDAGVGAGAGVDVADVSATTSATVTVVVATAGIQTLPRSALAAANAAYTSAPLANVRLTNRGALVPVQVVGNELRFYVESVGDRWNAQSYFQLALESDTARRSPALNARAVGAPAAGAVSVVIDRGLWQSRTRWNNQATYSGKYPGADGDHYFAAFFDTKDKSVAAPTLTATLFNTTTVQPPNALPLVSGATTYTFTVTPDTGVSQGSDFTFKPTGSGATLPAQVALNAVSGPATVAFTATGALQSMTVAFLPATTRRALWFESIAFARPAQLSLGGRGALFWGNPADTEYRWQNAPQTGGAYVVWDVTDPAAPVALSGASAAGFSDAGQAGRRYIVAGAGFVNTPALRAWNPLYARSQAAAHTVYVIPNSTYAAAMQPLVNLRAQQGLKANVADVTRIYDAYSGGYIDPRAIRRYLQEAYSKWTNPRPIAVVLVGDGTYDPRNNEQRERAPLLIPPYMMEGIDPWLGEAACDNCFGQLDGADPNLGDDPQGNVFSMELMVGRFPIKSVEELTVVVNKVVGYETAADINAGWRSSALYLADNYLKPVADAIVCAKGCPDKAGDFAATADHVRTLNPNGSNQLITPRVYYDPFPQYQNPPATNQTWRYTTRDAVRAQTITALNKGPALVVYNGHANIFNMGELEQSGTTERRFLLERNDATLTVNQHQLYVQLSMTCMTSSFASPANTGTVIDEEFFLRPAGGAVAIWGSSGQSVVDGHEALQAGFFGKLYEKPNSALRLGTLLGAGYLNVMLAAPDNHDILRTFLLLGDPLTRLRSNVLPPVSVPIVRK